MHMKAGSTHSQYCIQKDCEEWGKIEVLDNVVGIYIQYSFIKIAKPQGGVGGGGGKIE